MNKIYYEMKEEGVSLLKKIKRLRKNYPNEESVDLIYHAVNILIPKAPKCVLLIDDFLDILKASDRYERIEGLIEGYVHYVELHNKYYKNNMPSDLIGKFSFLYKQLIFQSYFHEKQAYNKKRIDYAELSESQDLDTKKAAIAAYFHKEKLSDIAYCVQFENPKSKVYFKKSGYMFINENSEEAFCNVEMADLSIHKVITWNEDKLILNFNNEEIEFSYEEFKREMDKKELSDPKVYNLVGAIGNNGESQAKNHYAREKVYFTTEEVGLSYIQLQSGATYKCISWYKDKFVLHFENGDRDYYYKDM